MFKFNWKRYVFILFFVFVLGVVFGQSSLVDFNLENKREQNFIYPDKIKNLEVKQNLASKNQAQKKYKVLEVVDGDTIKINYEGQKKLIRILGMNTPEKKNPFRPQECFGEEASKRAKEIFKNSKYVSLEFDGSQQRVDKFGRLLAYVFLENGENFEEKMIREGYAYEYTYHGRIYKYQKKFKEAQKYAEKNRLGLWAKDSCNGLKEFYKMID